MKIDKEEMLITCGERRIQSQGKISIQDVCTRHNLAPAQYVEVYLRKIPSEE